MAAEYDAVIIGSGPNGLSAGIALAREGRKVLIVEKHTSPGGGVRSEEGPLPGFHHDVCSAIFPMALSSPFFQDLQLEKYGLEWIQPEVPLAHPLDDGTAAVMHQSIAETADQFSGKDAESYRRIFESLLENADTLFSDLMAPPQLPSNPFAVVQFGLRVLASVSRFGPSARALFAGNLAHSVLPLDRLIAPNAVGMMLMLACHRNGWPIAKGGAAAITQALCDCFCGFGGEIQCDREINSIDELPPAKVYLFDIGPHALADIAGEKLPSGFVKKLRNYRYGPGVYKIDYALSEPVPWRAEECRKAGTVHVGGTYEEIAASEKDCWQGNHSEKPFVLTAQQTLVDSTRAPEGKHTFWAYCHVPSGSNVDMTDAIENQIERFAPGFRDTILARTKRSCVDFERYNPNYVGGDIIGGVTDLRQLLTRPTVSLRPHTTPAKDIFICSASSPPGAGVHGMCGYWAAREAMKALS